MKIELDISENDIGKLCDIRAESNVSERPNHFESDATNFSREKFGLADEIIASICKHEAEHGRGTCLLVRGLLNAKVIQQYHVAIGEKSHLLWETAYVDSCPEQDERIVWTSKKPGTKT